jgi:hypothetical protein
LNPSTFLSTQENLKDHPARIEVSERNSEARGLQIFRERDAAYTES